MPAGTHQVEWRAGDAPAGVYFWWLRAGAASRTRKLLRVR